MAARKEAEMVSLRAAFGLKEVREGDAFDRELQERKRQERLDERERAAKERARATRVRACCRVLFACAAVSLLRARVCV